MVRHEVPVLLSMFAGPSSTAVSYGIAVLWDLKYMIIVTSRFRFPSVCPVTRYIAQH